MRRFARTLGLGLLLTLALAPAHADDTTHRNLVQRALSTLQEAEREYQAGRRAQAAETARRAQTLIEQADRLKEGDVETAFLGVQACVFAGDGAGARVWLDRYARRTPYGERDANLPYARAMVWLLLENNPANAVSTLEAGFRTAPDGRTAKHDLLYYSALMADGGNLVRSGQAEEAVARFQRAAQVARRMRQRRKELAARANAGITLQQFGRPADSETVFRALQGEDPDNVLWPWYLAVALALQEKHAEAAPLFARVAEAVDEGRIPAVHRAMLERSYLALGRSEHEIARRSVADAGQRQAALERARKALARYTEVAPRAAEGWHRLGRLLYEDLDRPYEALPVLEKAHALDPACDGALRLLIRIAGRHGPPPSDDPEAAAAAIAAWDQRRKAWEKELEANADAWEAERARRRERSLDGSDGCP